VYAAEKSEVRTASYRSEIFLPEREAEWGKHDNAEFVRRAIGRGREAVLALLNKKTCNHSVAGNALLKWACLKGDAEILDLLLDDPKVHLSIRQPSTIHNQLQESAPLLDELLETALILNHKAIAVLLLKDRRVNPSAVSWIWHWCMNQDGPECMTALLQNPRYHYQRESAIIAIVYRWALENRYQELIHLIENGTGIFFDPYTPRPKQRGSDDSMR